MKRAFPILLVCLLAGCSMVPKYERPDSPVDELWPGGDVSATQDTKRAYTANIGWKDFFKDENLKKFVDLALTNNRDLRIAALNVEQARAQYRITRADLFPHVEANAGGDLQRVAKTLSQTGKAYETETYNVGLGVTSYEVDIFGRVRSLKGQALEQYLALTETRTGAQISLVSEVAGAYLTLLADRASLRLTQDSLKSYRETYNIQKKSFDRGVTSELDLKQAETSVRMGETNLAQYTRLVEQDMNALAFLIGGSIPDDLKKALQDVSVLDTQSLVSELPAGLPSDLLERRPDIRAAEHSLKAANANIGAARAAFFPTITLTAAVGTSSDGLSGLFADGSGVWQFAPQIRLPIFEGGANAAKLDVAKISKNIQIAQYEKAIQNAFREVSDALAGRKNLQEQLNSQDLLVQATERSYHLYEMRYRNGVDNYLNVLIWQRSLYTSQQALISTRLAYMQNLVTLYKALGGGWSDKTIQ